MVASRPFPLVTAALLAWTLLASPARAERSPPAWFVGPPPEFVEPAFPFLEGEDTSASVSVGDTSNGFLVNARRIRERRFLRILPRQKARNLRYGSDALVRALERAARTLYRETKAPLWIGNVGQRGGGDIPWSVSHNSGRDADIAFAYVDRHGKPVDPPDLVPLNGQGVARRQGLWFDPARTWIIVSALLSDPSVQVQYLFIANSLKSMLLTHAAQHGASADLLERASTVLRQPGNAAPHHDHLHLRIHCTARDVAGGCVHTGVEHPWSDLHAEERARAVARASEQLAHEEALPRARAVERVVILGAQERAEAILPLLDDPEATVRRVAADAVGALGAREHVPVLIERYRGGDELLVRLAQLRAVGSLGGGRAGRFLGEAMGPPAVDHSVRWPILDAATAMQGPAWITLVPQAAEASAVYLEPPSLLAGVWNEGEAVTERLVLQLAAIEAASRSERLEPVPALLRLLADRSPDVRRQAARALRMVTNLSFRVNWAHDGVQAREKGRARWVSAWRQSATAPRRAWLEMGFSAAGYRIKHLEQKHAWELVRATAGSDHVSYNAQRVLMKLFDHEPASLQWSKNDACEHWLRWLRNRRQTFKLGRPPKKTESACYFKAP